MQGYVHSSALSYHSSLSEDSDGRAALFPMRCRGVMFMFRGNGSISCPHQSRLLGAIPLSGMVRPDDRCRTRDTSPCLISVDFGLLTDTFVSCNSTTGQSLMFFSVSVRTLIANVILDLLWTFFFVTTTFWTFVDFGLQGCRIRYAIGGALISEWLSRHVQNGFHCILYT